jgi:PAS domain S-box-containing protein
MPKQEYQVIAEDITITEKLDKDLINLSPVGIAYINADGSIVYANSKLLQILQIPDGNGDNSAKMKLQELLYIIETGNNRSILEHLLAGETLQLEEIEYTLISGMKKWINISGNPHLNSDGKVSGATLICSDVTQYKELQAQLRQAQKMEALGQLTIGVAHDFNNLLTVIIGNTELMLMNHDPNNLFYSNVEEIRRAAESATNLTNRLLTFSRKQPLEISFINLNTVINDMSRMLKRSLRENIQLLVIDEPNLWNVKADPGQIEQIIINLAVNARDAMPHGGRFIIETANTRLNREYAGGKPDVNPGKYVMLAVTDTGCGMTNEVKTKLFESFFTTKEVGKGTGIGLSTAYKYVKQAGGYIWVFSEAGHGTTFKIFLPSVAEDVSSVSHKSKNNETSNGYERILVVEDEDDVRKTVIKMLTKHGYKIDAVRSGEEALEFCQNTEEPIHLLLTDLVMPHMFGDELADKLREQFPDLKVLVTSGYSSNTINRQRALKIDYPYIQKPFNLDKLITMVRSVLDS